MSNHNLTIELQARTDNDGRIYYIGKIKAPVLIDCSAGAAFLVFVSEAGSEAIQISPMQNKNNE